MPTSTGQWKSLGGILATACCALLLIGADTAPGGCAPPEQPSTTATAADETGTPPPPGADAAPATEPAPAASASTATPIATPIQPPAPLALPLSEAMPLREGWAVIVEKTDADARAWIEGAIHGGERLEIRTHNIARFDLHLPKLHLAWDKKVVLRMDDFNSQLTRKRWPVLHFQNTSAGAWITSE